LGLPAPAAIGNAKQTLRSDAAASALAETVLSPAPRDHLAPHAGCGEHRHWVSDAGADALALAATGHSPAPDAIPFHQE